MITIATRIEHTDKLEEYIESRYEGMTKVADEKKLNRITAEVEDKMIECFKTLTDEQMCYVAAYAFLMRNHNK